MSSLSELSLLTARPAAPAGPGYQTAKAGAVAAQPQSVATAPVQEEPPAARRQASEPTRSQSAEHRLRQNRPEEGPTPSETSSPDVELSFGDFIDLINPLHHIPIVGTIYRAITGDEIGGPAKILGGMLFGGPIGFIASAFETILDQTTGRDLGETVLAAFTDQDSQDSVPAEQVAGVPDIQRMAVRDDSPQDDSPRDGAPEDNPATAIGAPGPISSHKDPFGLQRGPAATIAAMPGALWPVEVTSAALPPSPQAAANLDTGSNSIAIDKMAQIHAVDGTAGGETNRTQSALGGNPLVPAAPGPGTLPVPIIVELASAGASQPGTQRSVPSFATTDRGFAERMLEALDKYEAQATERFRDNSRADRRLDLNL